jgi:hypothetical protein
MKSRRRVVGIGLTLVALVAAGLVYAAWTTSGSGTGYAKAKSAQALSSLDVSASTAATLYPGASGDVQLKISNPNPYPVRVTSVTGSGAITADSGHASCATTGVTFTDQTSQTIDVPANGSLDKTLNGAAQMSNASDNGCQGATFTVPVSLGGASNAP